MNKTVKRAKTYLMLWGYVSNLPDVEIGEEVKLSEIWDGNGEIPYDSISYPLSDERWINYEFKVIKNGKRILDTLVRITAIDII